MLTYTESNDDFVNISDIKTDILGAFYSINEAERHQQFVDFIMKKIKTSNFKYRFDIHSLMTNEPNYNSLLTTYTNAFHPDIVPINNPGSTYPLNHDKEFEALYQDIYNSTHS